MNRKRVEIEILKFDRNGYGVGIHNKKTYLVPYALPGERIIIEEKYSTEKVVYGKIVSFIRYSEERIEAPCPYFGICGGCQIQMTDYPNQLRIKSSILEESLKNTAFEYIEPSPDDFHYRVKAQFPLKRIRGKLYIGFYKRGSHYLVNIDECLIQKKKSISDLISPIKWLLQKERITIYDEKKGFGRLRYVVIRCDSTEKEILIIFVTSKKGFPKILAQKVFDIAPQKIVGIVENINPEPTNRIFGEENRVLIGRDYVFQHINNWTFRISSNSFFQANPEGAHRIIEFLLKNTRKKYNRVVDAFCGVGFFTIPFAEKSKEVIGFEIEKSSYRDCLRNIQINSSGNVVVHHKDARKVLKEYENSDLWLLDPPRQGLEREIVDAIKSALPEEIIYISCNLGALSNDLEILKEECPYEIVRIKPFDLFPQTVHIETVVFLKRK